MYLDAPSPKLLENVGVCIFGLIERESCCADLAKPGANHTWFAQPPASDEDSQTNPKPEARRGGGDGGGLRKLQIPNIAEEVYA